MRWNGLARTLAITLLAAAAAAGAQEVSFGGHLLTLAGSPQAPVVERASGTLHMVGLDAQELAARARTCLAAQGLTPDPQAPDGRLQATLTVQRSGLLSAFRARSRLWIEIGEGQFRLVQEAPERATGAEADAAFAPVPAPSAGGGKVLEALFEAERPLVDCLYR
ncbi:hypothetical protein [Thermomonas flagellata]|uniref:hypothetical protein n=1 Tax=Thermomonas flagellata TaxID=2888524 RepID=UPI001F049A34|nr:hypothetical protein [Thermomonas flagellata]